jgi:hypothetical protein
VQKDPDNQCLQLRYCIKQEDIEMAIKDWEDDWRIPFIIREIPTEIEKEVVREEKTHAEERIVPKKPRIGQNKAQHKKWGTSKTGTQEGNKRNDRHSNGEEEQHTCAIGTTKTGCDNTGNYNKCYSRG